MNTNLICHALIHNSSGEFLIMRRSKDETVLNGYWDIPGGSLDGKESPIHCVIREAKEEAGIEIPTPSLVFHTANIDKEKGERFVRLIFIAGPIDEQVSLSSEHDKFEWVDPGTAENNFKLVDYLNNCFETLSARKHGLLNL